MNLKSKIQKLFSRVDLASIAAVLLFLGFALSFAYFLAHPQFYTRHTTGTWHPPIWKICAMQFLLVLSAVLLFWKRRYLAKKLEKLSLKLRTAAFLVNPFVTLFFTDYIIRRNPRDFNNKYHDGPEMLILCFWLNIILILMLQVLVLIISNSLTLSCVLNLLVGVVFCIANYFIMDFRADPILASDFTLLGTAAEVAGDFEYEFTVYHIIALQATFVYGLAFLCLGSGRAFPLKKRLIFSAGSLVVCAVVTGVLFVSDFMEKQEIEVPMFKPLYSYWHNGAYVTMVRSIQLMNVKKPDGYSPDTLQAFTSEYPSDSAADPAKAPNIIIIVDEAFADLGIYQDLEPSEDYMPFLHSLEETSIHGYAYSSQYAKGTANSEFEVLTGNSVLLLPQSSVAFQLNLRQDMPSLVTECADLGYQGLLAVHPYVRSNYNRPSAYAKLGFETYLAEEDFGENPQLLREYISDMADFDFLIQKYEEYKASSDQPVLLYTMTMQNHSNYRRRYDNCPLPITLPKYPDERMEMYVNLIRYTDTAMEHLIGYFEQTDDPTVILFVGDHQPRVQKTYIRLLTGKAPSKWSQEEQMIQYAVPFYIWSNYGLPAKEYEKTSLNYLQSILFDAADLPMTGYQKYLLDLMQDIPAINSYGYWGADNAFYTLDDETSPYYDELMNYKYILYNTIFTPAKRLDGFFELQ